MSPSDQTEAKQIYQDLMDKVDVCFMAADVAQHAALIHVPHHMRTRSETFNIRTQAELKAAFLRYVAYAAENGAVTCKRECLSARFRTKDNIEGVHRVSFFDAKGDLIGPPTTTTSIIMRMQGRWMVCGSENTFGEETGISDAVRDCVRENIASNRAS